MPRKNYYETSYCVQKRAKHPVFWICGRLRVFAGVLRIFVGFLRGVLVVSFCFLQIRCKSALKK